MFVTVSPAKKLDMTPVPGIAATQPDFSAETQELLALAQTLDAAALHKLMDISDDLARLNLQRFADFATLDRKPAVLAFAGDTYQGFAAASLDADALRWAQDHMGILSGLYGLLRPLDAIAPYRLEMGSRLANPRGRTLYDFWGDRIAQAINARAQAAGTDVLVNCASQEYFAAVDRATLRPRVITPVFYEDKPGGPRIVSFFAKRARGAMARFIVEHRLTDPDSLRDFTLGGYAWQPDLSTPDAPVFLRSADASEAAA